MQLFETDEAAHFCAGYSSVGPSAGLTPDGLPLKKNQILREGTPAFDTLRATLLENAERNLFFAAVQYRRALDLMLPSSAPWAHVTLYYGSWYAAHGLLGLFGGAVLKRRHLVIEVARSSPGAQALHVRARTSTYSGSHQLFWDLFYRAVVSLRPRVAPQQAVALTPVLSDPAWQITRRNEVNYNSVDSLKLAQHFSRTFDESKFPASLPGALATQYRIFEALLQTAFSFADRFRLRTSVIAHLGSAVQLRGCVGELVYDVTAPDLVRHTLKSAVT